jgi:hypothetical protein
MDGESAATTDRRAGPKTESPVPPLSVVRRLSSLMMLPGARPSSSGSTIIALGPVTRASTWSATAHSRPVGCSDSMSY